LVTIVTGVNEEGRRSREEEGGGGGGRWEFSTSRMMDGWRSLMISW
jgi:hypothetical protein